jgi:hypothetical protein
MTSIPLGRMPGALTRPANNIPGAVTPSPTGRRTRRTPGLLTQPATTARLTSTPLGGLVRRARGFLAQPAAAAPAHPAPTPLGQLPGALARSATTTSTGITPGPVRGQEVAASFPEAAPTHPVPTDPAPAHQVPTAATPIPGGTRTTAEAKA